MVQEFPAPFLIYKIKKNVMNLTKEQTDFILGVYKDIPENWESMDDIHEEVVDICLNNDELFDLSEDDNGDIFEQYSNLIWDLLNEQ